MKPLLLAALLVLPPPAGALSFPDYMARVERAHPQMRALELDRSQAEAAVLERLGVFDPTFSARTSERRFNSSSAPGTPFEAKEHEASLELLTRWGPRLSASGRMARGDMKTPVSPTGRDGTLSYGLAVPLLRGAVVNPRETGERKARLAAAAAQAAYETGRLKLLVQAGEAYWKWIAARRKLGIERELLQNAEFRFTAVSTRAALGDLPRVAAVEAEQEVWIRRGRLERAARADIQASLGLLNYHWDDQGAPVPVPQAEPQVADPDLQFPSPEEVAAAISEALSSRPELATLELTRAALQVDRSLARNTLLPQLDALWTQGEDRGAGGIGQVRRVGLELSVPLLFRSGRGLLRQAGFALERVDWLERATRLRVENEVRDAASAVAADARRLQAAQRELDLAAELSRAERAAFNLGDSTLFFVNQRERAAAEAGARLADVRGEYEISRLSLQAARARL